MTHNFKLFVWLTLGVLELATFDLCLINTTLNQENRRRDLSNALFYGHWFYIKYSIAFKPVEAGSFNYERFTKTKEPFKCNCRVLSILIGFHNG